MRNGLNQKKGLAALLAAAALVVVVAMLLSFSVSADAPQEEIANFSFQTISGDSLSSPTTSLRFLFTIGSLDYSRVGFVFSKTNAEPTVGGSGCYLFETTSVHSSIWAGGVRTPAPDGRYWVAVKMTNIPNASFSTPIYVRPFVQDGSGVRYLPTKDLTACGAFGHDNPVAGKILSAPTLSDPGRQAYTCARCGEVVAAVDLDAYNDEIAHWQDLIDDFKSSDFASGSITTNLGKGTTYNYLANNPTVGQHPRVMFNESDIPGIQTALDNAPDTVQEAYYVAAFEDRTYCELGPADPDRDDGYHNFEGGMLDKLQLLALDYQLTGNKANGYLAIYALKNYLKLMDFREIDGDQCRHFGHVMYNAACVYDWCHDLMTAEDKAQIVLAVQKKCCEGSNDSGVRMEVGFPPSGQNAVSGHGCEYQILRDYLSFAIAIYDEYPGWWNYIAYRFYNEFVPVRNEFYEAQMYPQGTSLYVRIRFTSDLYSALLIKCATGVFPYESEENMKEVMRTVYSYEWRKISGKNYALAAGDDQAAYGDFIDFSRATLLSSHLFGDATMRAQLEYYQYGYSKFNSSFTVMASPAESLICSSGNITAAADRHEDMPLIRYNGGWLGQIIARDSWGGRQATVLMKIGCRTTANHEHYDSGSFQIIYRARLAGDTGVYDGYGNDHHYYYHQATVAHNSLLIYNSSLYSSDGGYYSGGQKRRSEPGSYANWQTSTYKTGEVTGVSYGYADVAQTTPTYAYIAGNVTSAYDSSVANEVTRRMLTVYDTGSDEVPMFFFVFDNINAKSSSYKKSFLLHTVTEPTVDGNTVTVLNGDGKLVLQNVIGNNVTITKRGGDGQNYQVNYRSANSYRQLSSPNSKDDGYWGRVEISPATTNAVDQLLNVMYVCDNGVNPVGMTATGFSTSEVKGAVIGNTAAVFVTSATRRSSAFTITAPGNGYLNYYVSGVAEGDWLVDVGGSVVSYATATEEGGFITFTAPAGVAVTLRQGTPDILVDGHLPEDGWDDFDFSNNLP